MMEFGHFRQSIILKDAKRLDPDEQLEKRLSDRARGSDMAQSDGKDKRKGKDERRGKWEEEEAEVSRGAEAEVWGAEVEVTGAHNDVSSSEGAGLSMSNDVPSGNGERARSKEEDHYGFLYSISEADRH